jgi:DNA-3-methyladenine glycosylase
VAVLILGVEFFARSTLTVARELLGQHLVCQVEGQRLTGLIVETEAYIGQEDSACHCSKGRTPRTEVMFGPAARTYVYLIYGMYHMLNLVTEPEGFPAAVLIRAVEPLEGLAAMRSRRPRVSKTIDLTNGPGKLCRALGIDSNLHNWNVSLGQKLWLEPGHPLPDAAVATGPRIGITYARPEDQAAPWRFWLRGNVFVSKQGSRVTG